MLIAIVKIEKEITRIDKNEEGGKNISYIKQFIERARFMVNS